MPDADRAPVWHTGALDALYERFAADPVCGLTDAAATAALVKHGPNELPEAPPVSAWKRIVAQFANPIVLTLVATVVRASLGSSGWRWPSVAL